MALASIRNSLRVSARSAELIQQSVELCRQASRAMAVASSLHAQARVIRSDGRVRRVWVAAIRPLPLTPPMLLEIAGEFQALASTAATPESAAAFRRLAFRYTALAGGYDTDQFANHTLH